MSESPPSTRAPRLPPWTLSRRQGPEAPGLWSYEVPQPWELAQGGVLERVVAVSHEATRVYAQQEAMLPTLHHDHRVDPAIGRHLQEVGRRTRVLRDRATRPDKVAAKLAEREAAQARVIPSRFPEPTRGPRGDHQAGDDDADQDDDDVLLEGRLEMMLMDQEWDTRHWNDAKIHAAIETLYEESERAEDPRRRALATTMLVRLLETHEAAVTYVESTIPVLMNRAFKNLSKITDRTRIFRVCVLLSVLAEWFAAVLSRESASSKCMAFLLRESEVCARIVQHHWRGVLFERSLARRDVDPIVRARLRSMHFIKNVELRHQFKTLREAMGPGGLPPEATHAYVKILFHLVTPVAGHGANQRRHQATADQRKVLGSGILVFLASLIPSSHVDHEKIVASPYRRETTEIVKAIFLELAQSFEAEAAKIVAILESNIVERVVGDLQRAPTTSMSQPDAFAHSALKVIGAISRGIFHTYEHHRREASTRSSQSGAEATESAYLLHRLEQASLRFILRLEVVDVLMRVLALARSTNDSELCEEVLVIIRQLAGCFGFAVMLDALTRNGGRALEQLILCFAMESTPQVVAAAVALFFEMTNHPDARSGFTTAGAVLILARWCSVGIEQTKTPSMFVLALTGIALLARQHDDYVSPTPLLASLGALSNRLDALYAVLLDLVQGPSKHARMSAIYLHQVNVLVPILLGFLLQVTPSCMESPHQSPKQRNISCIVLGRFFKVANIAQVCFTEGTVNHLALSIQCNRLDALERRLSKSCSTKHDREVHFLAAKESCKALSRLARCSSQAVNTKLKPSLTSDQVPQLAQAVICDVIVRLHVLEDVLALIRVPTDAAEFPEIEVDAVHAAIELVGYMRPMPYGESARDHFLKSHGHPGHITYANERLEMLVDIAAPSILHVLKEKTIGKALIATCCASLSRLAATNVCRNRLLNQGCLVMAFSHVPEVLYDASRSMGRKGMHSATGSSSPSKQITVDASVDDPGLLELPAPFYTLLGKICAIPDGRAAMMRAQVLPRILKRLQLTNAWDRDEDIAVKSEIAVIVRQLSNVNTAEGNTSELFVHFHVLELFNQIVLDVSANDLLEGGNGWRVLDHMAGALAALAEDVLVCVPKLVLHNVISRLGPFLILNSPGGPAAKSTEHHLVSLQYHIVAIVRAIASYPLGEFHVYLTNARIDASTLLLDVIKTIGYNFTLELKNVSDSSSGPKTIGELARETLRFIRECDERRSSKAAVTLPVANGIGGEREKGFSSPPRAKPTKLGEDAAFPMLPRSPSKTAKPCDDGTWRKGSDPSIGLRHALLPPTTPSTVDKYGSDQMPSGRARTPETRGTTNEPTTVNGINLLSTRPPGPGKPPSCGPPLNPVPGEPEASPHYIFATPKTMKKTNKTRSKRRTEEDSYLGDLMLDPLFQSSRHERQRRSQPRSPQMIGDDRPDRRAEDFPFYHELDRQGHYVQLRGRRSRVGDAYNPSIGQFHVENPTMNVFR